MLVILAPAKRVMDDLLSYEMIENDPDNVLYERTEFEDAFTGDFVPTFPAITNVSILYTNGEMDDLWESSSAEDHLTGEQVLDLISTVPSGFSKIFFTGTPEELDELEDMLGYIDDVPSVEEYWNIPTQSDDFIAPAADLP